MQVSAAEFGKILIAVGVVIAIIGFFMATNTTVPFLGKLPGDIHIQKKNVSFYFPLATCIVISIILSLLFRFFSRK